jgi:hypothetical protein
MSPQYRSLYYLSNTKGVAVYNPQNILVGHTTGYTARPNGNPDSIGSIEVDTITGGPMWIEGYGLRVMGMGILWRVFK